MWLSIVLVVVDVVVAALIFPAKAAIKAEIDRRVQHRFDERIEEFRAELRKGEEILKSKLREKEAENSVLHTALLSGQTQRQAFLDKRRLEAVERLWAAVIGLAPYKHVSSMMAVLNIDYMSKHANDPKVREFAKVIAGIIPKEVVQKEFSVGREQPFLSPMGWALYSAYSAIVHGAFLRAKVMELAPRSIKNAIDLDRLKRLVKAALPHQSGFVDSHDASAYHFLLDEIEQALLKELKRMLEYRDVDEASALGAANIMAVVTEIKSDDVAELLKGADGGSIGSTNGIV